MQILLAAVMAFDLLIPFALAPFYKGYSHRKMVMSVLGNPASPVRHLYSAWLVVGGAAFSVAAFFFVRPFWGRSPLLCGLLLVLLLVFSVGGMVVAGLFPVDENKSTMSTAAKVHGIGSVLGFMALLFGPLVLGILCAKWGLWGGFFAGCTCFVLALASFSLFVMSDKPAFAHSNVVQEGTWQRLSLLFMYLPFWCVVLQYPALW